jgi:ATP phosphoribosyltransferase regulatory subunit
MSETVSQIPNGMRYYFGREARIRRETENVAMSVFYSRGYEEIITPAVDYYALFERGMGQREAERAFKLTDVDGRLLALRPDVTSTVARAASTLFANKPRPLRFCYASSVFRQNPTSHAEWRRENFQTGCELIGVNTIKADLEALTITAEILDKLGLVERSCITLNSLEIFNGIAENLRLNKETREEMRALMDIRAADDLEKFLLPRAPADECAAFAEIARLAGKEETLQAARKVITNERSKRALVHLENLWQEIEQQDLTSVFELDFGDVAGLDYYTGLTFKIYTDGIGTRIGSGGRYDNLLANFGKAEPAIGFVLDLDALTEAKAREVKG